MALRPVLQALVLADHVYIDAKTGKKIIAGTFNHLTSTEFPTVYNRSKYAFLSLTEVLGHVLIDLRLVDLSNNEVLLDIPGLEVASDDPLETVEMVVEIVEIAMPHPGSFAFEALCQGELLGSLRLFFSRRGD